MHVSILSPDKVLHWPRRPISTYNGRATTKPGVDPQSHAIVYARNSKPVRLESEDGMTKEPKEIELAQGQNLHPLSRVNFAKVYTMEHNVLVMNIGKVASTSMARLSTYFRFESERLDREPPSSEPSGRDQNYSKKSAPKSDSRQYSSSLGDELRMKNSLGQAPPSTDTSTKISAAEAILLLSTEFKMHPTYNRLYKDYQDVDGKSIQTQKTIN